MVERLQALIDQRMEAISGVVGELARHTVWQIGPVEITSTVVNTWIIMAILFLVVFLMTRRLSERPRGAQTILELAVGFFYSIIRGGMGKAGYNHLPLIGTIFTFIVFLNLSWFIPGMRPPTSDIMTTAALATVTMVLVQVAGIRKRGLRGYFRHFAEPSILMAPMNLVEELIKPFSLTVRLFANMFGEEMAVSILFILIPLFGPLPIMALGVLMGIIQAFVFAMLAVTYLATATEGH